ncbi:MAG: ABC transporter permease [Desulfuromonadales bacterium]|nr:ABC transporter permease [Desulfuromonadales bacterium]
MNLPGWYPVFLREMLLFRRKLLKMGYLVSAMLVPLIYLVVFGYGLGRSVRLSSGDYLSFLIPGLVAMSSMTNSYTWVASALNLNRLYFKTFQLLIQAPISAGAIMLGEVLAGMVKGLFAASLLIIMGLCSPSSFHLTTLLIITTLLNSFMFACLGVITGMLAKSHEDTSTYNNFFILPMSFFSGTFFPLDGLPALLKGIIFLLPLSHTNLLIRRATLDGTAVCSLLVMLGYTAVFLVIGTRLIRNYSE